MNLTARTVVLILAVLCFLVAIAWARREPPRSEASMAGYAGAALLSLSFLLP